MIILYNDVKNIISASKLTSKEIYYDICKDMLKQSSYFKSALELSFDALYKHQIETMKVEFDDFFSCRYYTTNEELEELESRHLDVYVPECSVQGILLYAINISCRQAFIRVLNNYTSLFSALA